MIFSDFILSSAAEYQGRKNLEEFFKIII